MFDLNTLLHNSLLFTLWYRVGVGRKKCIYKIEILQKRAIRYNGLANDMDSTSLILKRLKLHNLLDLHVYVLNQVYINYSDPTPPPIQNLSMRNRAYLHET